MTEAQKVHFFLENNFTPRFSLKQKLYYKFLRKVIPISVRQKIQERVYASIIYDQNFRDPELLDILKATPEFQHELSSLYPEGIHSPVILTHDVEEAEGLAFIPEVIALEQELGFKSSWNIVPYKYPVDEGILRIIREAGMEIGVHGFNHDGKLYYSEKVFQDRVPYINQAIKKFGAVGFRSPMVHRNLTWLQRLDIEYDASCFDYDPFQPFPGGTKSIWPFIAGKFVELPYTVAQDHTLFYSLKRKDISLWTNKTGWLYENRGLICVLTHPDYLVPKDHLAMYRDYLLYLKSLSGLWNPLPMEFSAFWKKKFM